MTTPKLTVQELVIARHVGAFLLPIVRDMLTEHRKSADDRTAAFVREFEGLADKHRDADMLELAARFCATYRSTHPEA